MGKGKGLSGDPEIINKNSKWAHFESLMLLKNIITNRHTSGNCKKHKKQKKCSQTLKKIMTNLLARKLLFAFDNNYFSPWRSNKQSD
jgi:hypothetical protein